VEDDSYRWASGIRDFQLRGVALIGVVGRWLTFLGLTTVVGAVAFYYGTLGRTSLAEKDALALRAARLGAWASVLLLIGSLVRLKYQYAMLADPTFTSDEARAFFSGMVLRTEWGRIWIASMALAVAAWLAFARRVWPMALLVALLLCLTPGLAGHAMGDKAHPIVTITLDALHVAGASAWLGTLFVLALSAVLSRQASAEAVLALVTAFSPTALISASTLALTGLYASWIHVGSWSAVFGSPYGRILCIKLLLVAGVAAVGAYNWRWATPKLVAGHRHALRHSSRAELILGALVLLATAILVATPLPGEM
jgi:copper transport protein